MAINQPAQVADSGLERQHRGRRALGGRAQFFHWSTDSGKTWSAGITTAYTSLDIPGLPAGTYLIRVFATVGKVPGEPTQAVSLTIH
jgi:hypothetical protein